MRVTFLGNAAGSVPSLEALDASGHEVVLVATRVPRPAGRGGRLTPTPVAEAARRMALPVAELETVRSGPGFEALAASAPDALVVVAYGEILPPEVLAIPRVAPVNLHFSLLPELRGAAPVQRALLEGLTATGVTTIRMDQGLDTGPILLQAEEAIAEDDDAGSLGARLAAIGGRLVVDTLDRLQVGAIEERLQDEAKATHAPKPKPGDRVVDWTERSEQVIRRVRAFAPEPGASTSFRGRSLKLLRATAVGSTGPLEGPPGALHATREGPAVRTGDGIVRLDEVQPEGRRRMSGGEFVRGYRPGPGERLG